MSIEKVKLTTRQVLLYLVDGLVTIHEPFDRHGFYRKTTEDYYDWRNLDKKRFADNISRLAREGFVKIYLENDKNIIELSNKGKEKVGLILAQEYQFKYPTKWDQKWRLVIFDIPDLKKRNREILRHKLIEIGFIALQESVFIFPFDCKDIIDYLKNLLMIRPNVQYIIAETVETQVDLLHYFLKKGVLNRKMLIK